MRERDQGTGGFHGLTVARPIGLLVILLTLVLIGIIAYVRIPLQMLPGGISGTRFTIFITHPGSSAAENEKNVARVLEEQFETLPDLDDVLSTSREGNVRIRVNFSGEGNLELAKAELRDRVERARPNLPDTIDRINIWSSDDGDPPIMWFALLADENDPDADYLIEERVQRQLEAVDGVSRVTIWGLLDDSIRILLDEEKVIAANLDLGGLIRRLSADNFSKPMGEVSDGGRRFLLRSDMRFESLDEVEAYPVGNGLRLSDIATVERVKSVRERLTRINGRTAYYGMIQKESTANVVEVADRIEEVVASFDQQPELAGRVGMEVFFNQAGFIRSSLGQLESTALWGGGLAVLILFMFLRRVRMTLCVALSIPVSALLALAYTYFSGGTFNVLTMTGLTLALGMLVDNSVVVIESIARMRRQGMKPHAAAVAGARDVGLAIALATMTTVVVFLPLIFMIGNRRLRVFLAAMGIPLCTALIFSLVVALVFLPVISARILGERPRIVAWPARILGALSGLCVRGLAWILGSLRGAWYGFVFCTHLGVRGALFFLKPLRYVLAAALVAWFVFQVRGAGDARLITGELDGFGFKIPQVPGALGMLITRGPAVALGVGLLLIGVPRWYARPSRWPAKPAVLVPRGTSLLAWIQSANGALLGWTLDHRLLAGVLALVAYQSVGIPTRSMEMTSFGEDEDTTELEIDVDLEANFTLYESSQEMEIYEELLEGYREEFGFKNLVVRFHPGGGELGLRWTERQDPKYLTRLRAKLREELPKLPGHRLRFSREQQLGAASRQYVSFELRGPDADQLERYGEAALEILEGVPGLTDVSSPLEEAPEQIRLAFDREAAFEYGVTSQAALQNVSWALRGAQLPRYHEEGREVQFLIEYDAEELAGLDTLRDLTVMTQDNQVALSSFAEIEFQPGRRSIWRWNGMTTFNVQARVDDPTRQAALVEAGYDALEAELDMPRGFSLGRDQSVAMQQAEEMRDMKNAMLLSIVLVFLLMGILFESLVLPFSVLTTIPFAYLGAMWTLFLTGTAMDSVGWIGIIILVGVVVNNGIVLIDKIHRERLSGLSRRESVLQGAAARVRPILMTAMTTVFGLLPMALGEASRDGIDYRALATCVAGGLTFSTFFTLWIVPLAYTLADDLGTALRTMIARVASRGPAQRRKSTEPAPQMALRQL